jgi:site-specific recombinase XerD
MSPELAEVLLLHLDRLRHASYPTNPGAWVFPNRRGGRLNPQRVAQIVAQARAQLVTQPEDPTEHLTAPEGIVTAGSTVSSC